MPQYIFNQTSYKSLQHYYPMKIKEIHAKQIKDSRRQPTIEVSINNQKASSPSGKSTGKAETPPYRKSLDQSIKDINSLNLSNLNISKFSDLSLIEKTIKQKFKLKDIKQFGANALVALEIAILKALAKEKNIQLYQLLTKHPKKLPIPVGNAIGGGLHSHNENHPTFQEFLIIPKQQTAKQNIQTMNKIYNQLKPLLKSQTKNDEGAWQTSLSDEQILQTLSEFQEEIDIGIDIAASSFYQDNCYNYKNLSLDKEKQINYINHLIKTYNLLYTEDPIEESDFQSFSKIHSSPTNLVVGDDLTATQIPLLKKAIKQKSINAMIIKPNQNGSLLELKQIFSICKKHNIKTILSHRSGETLDTALADLAVGFQADYIKCGIATKYREVKLKRLIQIENSLSNP